MLGLWFGVRVRSGTWGSRSPRRFKTVAVAKLPAPSTARLGWSVLISERNLATGAADVSDAVAALDQDVGRSLEDGMPPSGDHKQSPGWGLGQSVLEAGDLLQILLQLRSLKESEMAPASQRTIRMIRLN